MNKPTKKTIEKTLKRLKKIQPKVRHYSAFGDDNHAAIFAQIAVLEGTAPDEYNRAGIEMEIYEAAVQAQEWLDGEVEENLADDWEALVQK